MTTDQPSAAAVDVRRAADRFSTDRDGVSSRHSFSFGLHYHPDNVRHGVLVAHNDETVQPGRGFDQHAHHDVEIVTWVVEGTLAHRDSMGNGGLIRPGLAQRMSAGSGVLHSERNAFSAADEASEPVRFVQMWVVPDEPGTPPSYEQREVDDVLASGQLVPVASGMAQHVDTGIRINNRYAGLHAARLTARQQVHVPEAPYLHLFVVRGATDLEGAGRLGCGDSVRFTGTGGHRVTALEDGTELLLWEMHAGD